MNFHHTHRLGSSAELLVAYRFLEAGRRPAWPLTVASYDLLVDIGDKVIRVQVKQATADRLTDRYYIAFKKHKGQVVYTVNLFDYLAFVIDPGRIYIIPSAACSCGHDPNRFVSRIEIGTQNERFASYLNQFALGPGVPPATHSVVTQARKLWFTRDGVPGGRKPHHRLTAVDAGEIRRLAALGTLSTKELAAQFRVTPPTISAVVKQQGRFKKF